MVGGGSDADKREVSRDCASTRDQQHFAAKHLLEVQQWPFLLQFADAAVAEDSAGVGLNMNKKESSMMWVSCLFYVFYDHLTAVLQYDVAIL
jgi:hypothetical protein